VYGFRKKRIPLLWQVTNMNLDKLEAYKMKGADSEKLQRLEEEQKRWLILYGPGGKFGFNQKWQRIFNPGQLLVGVEGISIVRKIKA